MPDISLMPVAGMNTEADDKELFRAGDSPRHYVRDAVNLKVNSAGEIELRPGRQKVTDAPVKNLWQSPLHQDVFGTLGDQWVRVLDTQTWECAPLALIGKGKVYHEVVNNQVMAAGPNGIYTYNGSKGSRMDLDAPPAPFVSVGSGSMKPGTYGVAIAWLRGGLESPLSEASFVEIEEEGGLSITFPLDLEGVTTGVRVYMTKANGKELLREKDYPAQNSLVSIPSIPKLGKSSSFRYLSRMQTGKYLKYWRGRVMVAQANVIRFSEALAYHLHDERHGFIQMPQRITFLQPVTGGIWVGQVDHVAFLQGSDLDQMTVIRKTAKPPVPDSCVLVDSDAIGSDLGAGGDGAALWLAQNGYVLGTASGQLVELHRGVMGGITARTGTSVVLDHEVITAVT